MEYTSPAPERGGEHFSSTSRKFVQFGAPVQSGGPVSYAPVIWTVTGVDTILLAYGKVVRTLFL